MRTRTLLASPRPLIVVALVFALAVATATTIVVTAGTAAAQDTAEARLEGESSFSTFGSWKFRPQCAAGPCDVQVVHSFCPTPCRGGADDERRVTDTLAFDGSGYTGSVRIGSTCVDASGAVLTGGDDPAVRAADAVLEVELEVAEAHLSGGELVASRVVGTYRAEVTGRRFRSNFSCGHLQAASGDLDGHVFGPPPDPEGVLAPTSTGRPTVSPSSPEPAAALAPFGGTDVGAGSGSGRSTVAVAVRTPDQVSWQLRLVAENAALALLLAFLIVFPSQLFNSTLEAHYDEVRGWFARRPWSLLSPRAASAEPATTAPNDGGDARDGPWGRRLTFVVVAAVGALLGGMLDPTFGANSGSAALFLGVLGAVLLGTAIAAAGSAGYTRVRHGSADGYLRAFPGALLVAVVCVLVSRAAGFQPGYLFGLIGGFVVRRQLDRREEGQTVAIASVITLAISVAAWLVWSALQPTLDVDAPHFGLLVVDALLATTFVAGLEGLVLGLVPLRDLSGDKLRRWSWGVWAAVYGVSLFGFVHVLVRPQAGYVGRTSTASLPVTLALFVAFAVVSTAFWAYFRVRRPAAPAGGTV